MSGQLSGQPRGVWGAKPPEKIFGVCEDPDGAISLIHRQFSFSASRLLHCRWLLDLFLPFAINKRVYIFICESVYHVSRTALRLSTTTSVSLVSVTIYNAQTC